MYSFVIWSIGTKFNLVPPSIGVSVNYPYHHGTSRHPYKRIGLGLTSTMWDSKKMCSKMRCTSSISHNVKSLQNPMSHIIRLHATPPHLCHAAHVFQAAYWWVCPLYTLANLNFFVSFRLMKACITFLLIHETFLPLIWASRHRKLDFGLGLLDLATVPPSNIWFIEQHDLPCWRKATFYRAPLQRDAQNTMGTRRPRRDTRDLWRRRWEAQVLPVWVRAPNVGKRLPPTGCRSHEGEAISYA